MRSLETWLQWIAHGSISRKTEYGLALPLPGWPEMDVEMKLVPVNIFIQSGMQASSVIAIAKLIWMEGAKQCFNLFTAPC